MDGQQAPHGLSSVQYRPSRHSRHSKKEMKDEAVRAVPCRAVPVLFESGYSVDTTIGCVDMVVCPGVTMTTTTAVRSLSSSASHLTLVITPDGSHDR